jgi:transcription-repair coupling factor (superfamily II helicase)
MVFIVSILWLNLVSFHCAEVLLMYFPTPTIFHIRIEIMGDQVESLRTFNPESQISIEKLEKISILPDLSQLAEKT